MPSTKQEAKKSDRVTHKPLVDIKSIPVDKSLPVEERVQHYLELVKNPYHFACGKTPVEIQFAPEDEPHLQRVMTDYFISKKANN